MKRIWTANPEKFWEEGEVLDLPDELANQLLTHPNFVKLDFDEKVEKPEEGLKNKKIK